jgi:sigma-B regulation protein RsbU (phosphoserine phosphatase)
MTLSLRARLSVIVLLAIALMAIAFTGLLIGRDRARAVELSDLLKSAQRLAWERTRASADESLANAMRTVLASALGQTIADRKWDTVASQVVPMLSGQRLEVFDMNGGSLWDSGDEAVVRSASLPLAALIRTRGSSAGLAGVSHSQAQGFVVFRAATVTVGGLDHGIVVISIPLATLLDELRESLRAEVGLVTLRGGRVAVTDSEFFRAVPLPTAISGDLVQTATTQRDSVVRTVTTVVDGWDERPAVAIVSARDVTELARDNRLFLMLSATLLGVGGLGVAAFVWWYVRGELRPLTAAAAQFKRLTVGDTTPDLDADDRVAGDEVGQILATRKPLRSMVAENLLLHEEQQRVGFVQERMIVDAMTRLASNLPENTRDEDLEEFSRADGDAGSLTKLANTLSRLTDRVTTQRVRLIELITQLQAALQVKEQHARLKGELEIAARLQLSLLPKEALNHPAGVTHATMIPALEIGGDFYDFWMLDEHTVGLVVADVSGKGVAAGVFAAITRTLLRSYVDFLHARVSECIERVNNHLALENAQSMFVTAWFGVADLRTGHIAYVNAGHNPPVLIQRNGVPQYLPRAPNPPLAAMDGLPFSSGELIMQAGDNLLLYTDGVTEATNSAKQLFGEAALLDAVRDLHSAGHVPPKVVSAIRAFEAGAPQADDITILVFEYRGRSA